MNVYGMIENNSLNDWDVLGLQQPQSKPYPYTNTIKNTTPRKLFKAGAEASLAALDLTNNYVLRKSGLRMTPVFPPRKGRRTYPIYHEYSEPPEYCGRLCCSSTGNITRTKPVCGGFEPIPDDEKNPTHITYHPKSCDPDLSPPCPEGSKEVGFYHSHPPGDNEFSNKDLRMANNRLVFVGTERGVQVASPWMVSNYKDKKTGAEIPYHVYGVKVFDVDPKTGKSTENYKKRNEEYWPH